MDRTSNESNTHVLVTDTILPQIPGVRVPAVLQLLPAKEQRLILQINGAEYEVKV
jgi:hypothetical protein